MYIATTRCVYRLNPMIDIASLKKDCMDKADTWEMTYRAKRPIKNHPGLFAKNKINAQRWYGV